MLSEIILPHYDTKRGIIEITKHGMMKQNLHSGLLQRLNWHAKTARCENEKADLFASLSSLTN
jgi:hypothetical protein